MWQTQPRCRSSRYHFQRIFRAMTGESVAGLVRGMWLKRAPYRLRHESVNLTATHTGTRESTELTGPSLRVPATGGSRYRLRNG